MGRARKPTSLKVIAGTDRSGAAGRHEPQPLLLNDLEPPAHLSEESAAVWRELAPMLRRIQVLTEADVIAFEMLCDSVADYRTVRARRGPHFVTTSPKTGAEMLDQLLVAQQMLAKRAEGFMAKFGMDPASRSRLMVDPQLGLFDDQPKPGDKPTGTSRFFTR